MVCLFLAFCAARASAMVCLFLAFSSRLSDVASLMAELSPSTCFESSAISSASVMIVALRSSISALRPSMSSFNLFRVTLLLPVSVSHQPSCVASACAPSSIFWIRSQISFFPFAKGSTVAAAASPPAGALETSTDVEVDTVASRTTSSSLFARRPRAALFSRLPSPSRKMNDLPALVLRCVHPGDAARDLQKGAPPLARDLEQRDVAARQDLDGGLDSLDLVGTHPLLLRV